MAKLLLIEDDISVQKYFSTLVGRMGHVLEVASDGTTGLQMVSDPAVEIILTDLNLDGPPSGMELVRAVREARPTTPIVVVSGFPTKERLEECKQLGVADFLTKPFEMAFLSGLVERLLEENSQA